MDNMIAKYGNRLLIVFSIVIISLIGMIYVVSKYEPVEVPSDNTLPIEVSTTLEPTYPENDNIPEVIVLSANPVRENDSIAVIRLKVEYGNITGYEKSGLMSLGACTDQKEFTSRELCIDVSKREGFKQGDALGKLMITWTNKDHAKLIFTNENGYYNGTSFTKGEVQLESTVAKKDYEKEEQITGNNTAPTVTAAQEQEPGSQSTLTGLVIPIIGILVLCISLSILVIKIKVPQNLAKTTGFFSFFF